MKQFDLRSYSVTKQIEAYGKHGKTVYFSERKSSVGGETLFLFALDTSSGKDEMLYYVPLASRESFAFVTYKSGVFTILAELTDGGLWMVRVQESGELSRTQVNSVGRTIGCHLFDDDTLLLFAEESNEFADVFAGYRRLTGRTCLAYLYNLRTCNRYYIRDSRVSGCTPERIFFSEEYAILNKEKRESLSLDAPQEGVRVNKNKGKSKEDIRFMKKSKFISDIMDDAETLRLELICSSPNWDGNCLVLHVAADVVYYYLRNESSGLVHVCAYNLKNGEKTLLDEHIAEQGREDISFFVNPADNRILRVTPGATANRVTTLTGNRTSVAYPKRLGKIIGLLGDQHVILEAESEKVGEAPYYSIYNAATGDFDGFVGRIRLIGDVLLIY